MSTVMIAFWRVRKKFSPYVENGKPFLAEYARVIAYDKVSSTYAGKDNPRAERAFVTVASLSDPESKASSAR